MADLFGLTAAQVARLKQVIQLVEAGELGRPGQTGWRAPPGVRGVVLGRLDANIAAISSLTGNPVSGTMSVYTFTSTGTVDTGDNETVWNFAKMQAVTGRWTFAERNLQNGKYVITFQTASTTGCT